MWKNCIENAYEHISLHDCVGTGGLFFIQFIAVTLFMFVFDCITISLSGMVAIPATIRARAEEKIGIGYMIFFGISAFVFCIDVISAVILYVKIIKANKKTTKIAVFKLGVNK